MSVIIFVVGLLHVSVASPPSPLLDQLQKQADAVVAYYSKDFPNLTISVAYRDANHDVALAAGKVAGRDVTPKDTFLYGSGTKPFTAAGVLRLIDSGKVKATDKLAAILDPYMKKHGKPSMRSIFGENISEATVLQVIRMGSGIRDFEDDYTFDKWCLAPENSTKFRDYPYDAMQWSVGPQNSKNSTPLYCMPGTCTAYSSTSYDVAGLVLAAVLEPEKGWYDFDLASAISDERSSYSRMSFPPRGNSDAAKISEDLTVPGTSIAQWGQATIFDQNPSFLGWTCGNMVASPSDVAKYFYHLLDHEAARRDRKPLLSESSRAEMTNFKALTTGWEAGNLEYGAGLQNLTYGFNTSNKILVHGHEGDTYGFLSSSGYVPSLKGGYSVTSNVDVPQPMRSMVCYLMRTLQQAIGGASLGATWDVECMPVDLEHSVVMI